MWKKRLIAIVTFLGGLYYFLEFIVPATVPWKTVEGKVAAPPSKTQVMVTAGGGAKSVPVDSRSIVSRLRPTGAYQVVEDASTLKVGEQVKIGPTTYLSQWQTNVINFFIVLGALAWGMGLFSLWMVHSTNIRKRRPEWSLSIVFFFAVAVGVAAGLGYGQPKTTNLGYLNDVVANYMMMPMGSTVFSLLAFYMASAAYRSFKAKSSEAILMMVSAMIVMLGQIPVGLWLTHGLQGTPLKCLQIPNISQWLLYGISSAAVKGMWFGMMLGSIAVGLRFWLSLERGAFFDREL